MFPEQPALSWALVSLWCAIASYITYGIIVLGLRWNIWCRGRRFLGLLPNVLIIPLAAIAYSIPMLVEALSGEGVPLLLGMVLYGAGVLISMREVQKKTRQAPLACS